MKSNAKKRKSNGKKRKSNKETKTKQKSKRKGNKGKQDKKKGRKSQKKEKKLNKNKKTSRKSKKNVGTGRQNSTSSTDCPDLQCIINVAQAFKVEKDTVKNFFKQMNRIESQLKTLGGKLKKKGTFEEDGNSLKSALGNNITNATCGSTKLA